MRTKLSKEAREVKIRHTQEIFRGEFGKVHSRFVAEALVGMTASGSVRLSEIARALEEDIPLHATRKRLSRNLALEGLEEGISNNVLERGSTSVGQDTLLVASTSRLQKKYAKNMEFIDRLDGDDEGNEQTPRNGYSICEVSASEAGSNSILPLAKSLWSRNAPDAVSETEKVRSMVDRVRAATEGRGVVAYKTSCENLDLLTPWTADPDFRYLVELDDHEGQLLYKKNAMPVSELIDQCELVYGDVCQKVLEDGEELSGISQFGFLPVRLPDCPDRSLGLVCAVNRELQVRHGFLTTKPLRRSRKVLQTVLEAAYRATLAERTAALYSQLFDFDDVRVLGYRRLKNMAALTLLNAQYLARLAPEAIHSEGGLQFNNGNITQPPIERPSYASV
jgi:hypothetical protein